MRSHLIIRGEGRKRKAARPGEVSLSPEVTVLLDHLAEELAGEYLRLLKPLKAGPDEEEKDSGKKGLTYESRDLR